MKKDRKSFMSSMKAKFYIGTIGVLSSMMLVPTTTYAQAYQVTTVSQSKNHSSHSKTKRDEDYMDSINAKVNSLVKKYPDATQEDLFAAVVAYNVQSLPENFSSKYLEKIKENAYVGTSEVDFIFGNTEHQQELVYYSTIPTNQFALSPGTQIDYIIFDKLSFEICALMTDIAYNDFTEKQNLDFNYFIEKCIMDLNLYTNMHQELLKNNQFLASKITNYYEFLNNQKQKFQESPAIVYSKK